MKDIELAEKMVSNLDWFKKQPDWQETVEQFRPMIEEIMRLDGCNVMKAAMPILKICQEENDQYVGGMLMAICVEIMLNKAGV